MVKSSKFLRKAITRKSVGVMQIAWLSYSKHSSIPSLLPLSIFVPLPPVFSYTNWKNLGNKSQTPLSTMYHEFIKCCCWLVKEKPYDTKGGNPSGNEWNCALTVRLPLCGRVALLARNTPGSARQERFTQSSLWMPSADGMLNEAIGPTWNLYLTMQVKSELARPKSWCGPA